MAFALASFGTVLHAQARRLIIGRISLEVQGHTGWRAERN
jgi:hypothetical protein